MSRFIESIRIQNGLPCNLPLHEARWQRTRRHFFPDAPPAPSLSSWLQVPESCNTGLFKCRIVYAEDFLSAEFLSYTPRPIRSLKIVQDNAIDYAWKYEDRSAIGHLLSQKGDCDDILIAKNGYLTDSSYSNVAFYNGAAWFTPEAPLLEGVQRQRLLQEGRLQTASIRIDDLKNFSKIALLNAMLELGDCTVDIDHVLNYNQKI